MKGHFIQLQLTLVVILLSSGCMPFQIGVISDNGRKLPKRPDWDLNEQYLEGDAPLPIDVVFVHKAKPHKMLNGEMRDQYFGYRFFKKGHVFSSYCESQELLLEALENIQNGGVGYYSMENGKIIIETFTTSMASFTGITYAASRGTYNADGTISREGFGIRNSKLHEIDPPQIFIPIQLPEKSNKDVDW